MTDGYGDCLVVLKLKEIVPLVRHAQGVRVPPEDLARIVTMVTERVMNAAIAQGPSWGSNRA